MTDDQFDDLLKYKIIREMSKEELVEEILNHYRSHLMDHDTTDLKKTVIANRVEAVQNRLLTEAGLKIEKNEGRWPFRGPKVVEDDVDDVW